MSKESKALEAVAVSTLPGSGSDAFTLLVASALQGILAHPETVGDADAIARAAVDHARATAAAIYGVHEEVNPTVARMMKKAQGEARGQLIGVPPQPRLGM